MNRKNLTAAVLAGLAGVAGIAGTAQAVNLNPDGVGQVLIYPFYTSNGGNQTLLSVVNTTNRAKAVKVRFLEGYNSREVLDFNLYLSRYDVWVATVAEPEVVAGGDGATRLIIPDSSCTVPYLYGMGVEAGYGKGIQDFLPYAYTGKFADGGPTTLNRGSEGHVEMIEMGTLNNDSARAATEDLPARMGSATAATHVVADDGSHLPRDCEQLVRNWTDYDVGPASRPDPLDGMWFDEALFGGDGQAHTDTERNSGGLFGSAAIVNVQNGTMFTYDPKAVQGFDKTDDGMHYVPGTIHPSLDDGDQFVATIFFGTPTNRAVDLYYPKSVDAVSALFMHDNIMNEFTIEDDLAAATEWLFTFPTKSFYVDIGDVSIWTPNPEDPGCNGWDPGEPFPPWNGTGPKPPGWEQCEYLETDFGAFRPPFTSAFNGEACEFALYENWDREEFPSIPGEPGTRPPVVSPAPPGPPPRPDVAPFELCYEVNILRFGVDSVFETDSDLFLVVEDTPASGWANVNFNFVGPEDHEFEGIELHQDMNGLVGLPVIGFAAEHFVNAFVTDGVLANYGGLFGHKASVRRIYPDFCYHYGCEVGATK
jgi:hypothetical protein